MQTIVTEKASDIVDVELPPGASSPEPADADALTRSAGRGALWQVVGAGYTTVVQLGASMVLARVLDQKDFGIMGMAVLAQGLIGRIGALGTGAGVVAKKDVTQDDLSTTFWIGSGVQGLLFLVTFLSAPLIAAFFKTPDLADVTRVTSLIFLITGAGAVSGTLLGKHLKFGTLKIIECAGFTLQSGLAILLATVFKMGYWSLALSIVAATFATTAAGIAVVRWIPSFRVNWASFRYMFRYGVHGLGASIADYFHNNIDYLLVGRLLGAAPLGLYEFAYRIPHMIQNRLAYPVGIVMFPVLSKVQETDDRLSGGYIKVAKYISLIAIPLMGGLAATAEPAVAVLWGDKWLPAVLPLQILCVSAALRSIISPVGSIFLCRNRPDVPFKFGMATLVITFAIVGTLGYFYGLYGVAAGMVLSVLPGLYLIGWAFRLTHTPMRKLLTALLPAGAATAVSSTLAALAVWLVGLLGGPDIVALAAGGIAGFVGYVAVMYLLFRDTLRDVWQTVRIVMGRKRRPAA